MRWCCFDQVLLEGGVYLLRCTAWMADWSQDVTAAGEAGTAFEGKEVQTLRQRKAPIDYSLCKA